MDQNLIDHRAGHVHRDGKSDSSTSTIITDNRRVDADELAAQIDKGAT
jgi:hypothetical protein